MDKFLALFPYRFESSVKRLGTVTWRPMSRFYYLSDADILSSLESAADVHRAVSIDSSSRLVTLRIPAESCYHTPESLTRLLQQLEFVGIPAMPYQLEADWYIYIFLAESIPSVRAFDLVGAWLESQGYVYEELRISAVARVPLPLQTTFSWLSKSGQIQLRREQLSLEAALEHFLSDMETNLVSAESFERAFTDFGSSNDQALSPDLSGQSVELSTQDDLPHAGAMFENQLSQEISADQPVMSRHAIDCSPDSSAYTVEVQVASEVDQCQLYLFQDFRVLPTQAEQPKRNKRVSKRLRSDRAPPETG